MFREITLNTPFFSQIYNKYTIYCADSRKNHLVFRKFTIKSRINFKFTINSLSFSRINYEFTNYFLKSLCINYIFANSLWIHFFPNSLSLWKTINHANSLRINYQYRDFGKNSRDGSLFYYKFTLCFVNKLWIHYLFRDCKFYFTMSSLDVSRIFHEFTWCFANIPWIHLMFREYTMNSLDIPRIYYEFP